jgi:hypothetical protein
LPSSSSWNAGRRRAAVSELARVLIVGDHPHHGATGTLTGEVVRPADGGPELARVDLDTPDLGASACCAEAADLMPATLSYKTVAVPMCPECAAAPAIDGGRCFTCRGKSML